MATTEFDPPPSPAPLDRAVAKVERALADQQHGLIRDLALGVIAAICLTTAQVPANAIGIAALVALLVLRKR